MENVLSTRKFEQDGFTVVVKRILDTDSDLSYLEQEYLDESEEDREKYKAEDAKRLAAFNRGNWHFVGVAVSILKQTKSSWANGGLEVGRASVWGTESDSEQSHFVQLERQTVAEAFAEVDRLKEALGFTEPPKKTLVITGRKWFNRGKGHSYFSSVAVLDGKVVATIDYESGYGQQYVDSMMVKLIGSGLLPADKRENEPVYAYCERHGIVFTYSATDVTRKKDL